MEKKVSLHLALATIALFLVAVIACVILDYSLIWAFIFGNILFLALALKAGVEFKLAMTMLGKQLIETRGVLLTLLIIGALTASWRASGTIALFVYYGAKLISPYLFVLITFIVSAFLAYLIGTAFGVAGVMAAIFMTISNAGGVNPIVTAGAIMSGVYFGDRTSPASSAFITIQDLTKLPTQRMVSLLLKNALVPLVITTIFYGIISYFNPMQQVDVSMTKSLTQTYHMSFLVVIPALFILVFPFLKIKTPPAMGISIVLAGGISIALQDMNVMDFLKTCLLGYQSGHEMLGPMIDGGGVISMLEICVIVALSSTLTPLIRASGVLDMMMPTIKSWSKKLGLTPVTMFLDAVMNAIFCNQSAPLYITHAFMTDLYDGEEQLMLDMANMNIVGGIIPWSLASTVPLTFLQVGVSSLPLAFFIYFMPIYHLIHRTMKKDASVS